MILATKRVKKLKRDVRRRVTRKSQSGTAYCSAWHSVYCCASVSYDSLAAFGTRLYKLCKCVSIKL